jgi:hypothetical protein
MAQQPNPSALTSRLLRPKRRLNIFPPVWDEKTESFPACEVQRSLFIVQRWPAKKSNFNNQSYMPFTYGNSPPMPLALCGANLFYFM